MKALAPALGATGSVSGSGGRKLIFRQLGKFLVGDILEVITGGIAAFFENDRAVLGIVIILNTFGYVHLPQGRETRQGRVRKGHGDVWG